MGVARAAEHVAAGAHLEGAARQRPHVRRPPTPAPAQHLRRQARARAVADARGELEPDEGAAVGEAGGAAGVEEDVGAAEVVVAQPALRQRQQPRRRLLRQAARRRFIQRAGRVQEAGDAASAAVLRGQQHRVPAQNGREQPYQVRVLELRGVAQSAVDAARSEQFGGH